MPRPRLATSEPELVDEARAVAARVHKATRALESIRAERDDVVRKLRAAGWGYDRIAAVLDITKTRVQQILREQSAHSMKVKDR